MPGWWIAAILFFLLAIVVVIASVFAGQQGRLTYWGIAGAAGLFGVLLTLVSAYDRVDTRNVGIITEFGKPVGVHGAGIVWHAPWRKVSELSEAIQLQAFESNNCGSFWRKGDEIRGADQLCQKHHVAPLYAGRVSVPPGGIRG